LTPRGINPSYTLFVASPSIITYPHLVIQAKISLLPNSNKKGPPNFNMPLEVWENLVSIVREMERYLRD
jgi:hypothetical protein